MNVAQFVAGAIVSTIIYGLTRVIYNLWFHPLANYPGPFLARATNLWFVKHTIDGTIPFDICELQKTYGEVIRIKPDELAYTTADSWKQIYGYHAGKKENPKDDRFYHEDGIGPKIIFGANQERHGEMRRLLTHGFSEKSLRDQEPVVQKYIDSLISRLHEAAADGSEKPIDLVQWFNFFTFDVIGDLAYGEPYHCLATGVYHPWIASVFGSIKFGCYGKLLNLYPLANRFVKHFMMQRVSADRLAIVKLGVEKANKRRYSPDKAREYDLVYKMADKNNGITDEEFAANTSVLLVAGSETTATLLCGFVYFIMQNPRVLKRLQEDIRSAFNSEAEITSISTNRQKYLLACLNEGFRMYPPVPYGMPRRTIEPIVISGRPVPEGTVVSTWQWASYRSEKNFHKPHEFIPERWIEGEDDDFKDDVKQVLQPFAVGPRNCIGMNLAYMELKLVLARLIFNFDFEATPECREWHKQKAYVLWEKSPLLVKLKPIHRAVGEKV